MTIYLAGGAAVGGSDAVLRDAIEGVSLWGYGTSIMFGYLPAPYPGNRILAGARYMDRLANRLGSGPMVNNGRVGNTLDYMANQVVDPAYGTNINWLTTNTGLVVLDIVTNNAAQLFDATSEGNWQRTFNLLLQTVVRFIQLASKVENTDGSITYGGTWSALTTSSALGFSSSTVHKTTTLNDYVEFSITGASVDIFIAGMDSTQTSPLTGGDVEVKVDGAVNQTVNTSDLCRVPTNDKKYGQYCISLRSLGAGAHTIRLTNKTASANLYFDCWGYPSATPVYTVLVKGTQRTDISAGAQASYQAGLIIYNGYLDTIAATFSRVLVADPGASPFTTATHLTDGLHPNHRGHEQWADVIETQARTLGSTYTAGLQAV